MSRAAPIDGACWIDGRWLRSPAELESSTTGCVRDIPALPPSLASTRAARADRVTRLAAAVAWEAWNRCEPARDLHRVAVLSASVLASAETNAKSERRRLRTGRVAPRDFPYTAPNAWGGEVGTVLGARGPCTSFVGGVEVGLVAVARAVRWIETGACDRAVVLAAEVSPEDSGELGPPWSNGLTTAAALIIDAASNDGPITLRAAWIDTPSQHDAATALSVDGLARLVLAVRERRAARIVGVSAVGASVAIDVIA